MQRVQSIPSLPCGTTWCLSVLLLTMKGDTLFSIVMQCWKDFMPASWKMVIFMTTAVPTDDVNTIFYNNTMPMKQVMWTPLLQWHSYADTMHCQQAEKFEDELKKKKPDNSTKQQHEYHFCNNTMPMQMTTWKLFCVMMMQGLHNPMLASGRWQFLMTSLKTKLKRKRKPCQGIIQTPFFAMSIQQTTWTLFL